MYERTIYAASRSRPALRYNTAAANIMHMRELATFCTDSHYNTVFTWQKYEKSKLVTYRT